MARKNESYKSTKPHNTIKFALLVSIAWTGCGKGGVDDEPMQSVGESVFEVDAEFPDAKINTDSGGGTKANDANADASMADATVPSDAEIDALETSDADLSDADLSDADPSDAVTIDPDPETFEPGFAITEYVRTNASHLGFIDQGDDGLVIISIFVRMVEGESFDSVLVHGEIANNDNVMRCIPLVDVSRIGSVDILMVVDAAPHDSGSSAVSTACIPPGGRGVFRGIENEVPRSLLEDSTTFTYSISALERDFPPHPATPTILSMERMLAADGLCWVKGQFLSSSMTIYNLGIDFYAKDDNGLVVDDTSAFPLELDTIPADSVQNYESYAFAWHRGELSGLIHMISFINGPAPSGSSSIITPEGVPLSKDGERIRQARRNKELYHALRARLEAP